MTYKVKLKNSRKQVTLSEDEHKLFSTNKYYKGLGFLDNLRLHSSGYAFFQRNYPQKDGTYKNLTIYLHKAVAEKFVKKPRKNKKLFVRIINGKSLDCRSENLEWVTMSELRRNQKSHSNATGYRGVVKVGDRKYRAVLYKDKKRFDLGLFPSAVKAAKAYNEKSKELFGSTQSLNKVKK